MENNILSLDTSSSSTGWALYVNGEYHSSGVIDLKKEKNSETRLQKMVLEIFDLIDHYSPMSVITELTVVTRNPAAQRMLTMILGAIYGKCISDGIEYTSLRPTEWRKLIDPGKKPRKREELKEWSKQKVKDIFGIGDIVDDVSDAILIGLAYIRLWNNN